MAEQVERLARTRYWDEARAAIAACYQRAFGRNAPVSPSAGR